MLFLAPFESWKYLGALDGHWGYLEELLAPLHLVRFEFETYLGALRCQWGWLPLCRVVFGIGFERSCQVGVKCRSQGALAAEIINIRAC